MRRTFISASVISITAFLSACGGEPAYVASSYRYNQRGEVMICYRESVSTREQVQALADQACGRYQRTAVLWSTTPGQCEWRNPTRALFVCQNKPGQADNPATDQRAVLRRNTSSETDALFNPPLPSQLITPGETWK